ncbi:M23 family metallopeptidase [Pseudochryseolinea flava]|uniref:M23 family metallopeptidase n=1 Tax=Pseudochryseolinea flava TaxID=2059302 RepID=UPI001403D281|nr:M23 family metallopeptidase [Pseudochryseolinea flava]
MRSSKIVLIFFFTINALYAQSQFSKPEITFAPAEKYIYPINPGQPGSLAGTMGELRSTHFHSGIDIRTNNMIGFPVRASKSGYISRVTVGPSGYGNIIYLTHPDGNTTLYAHLDKFKGAVAKHILQEQYNAKKFDVDLFFTENQFRVNQGDTIALSGNSGSSSGPHLHFDIRDANNYALDPLKVADFPEVAETLPPAPEKIAVRTLDKNARINDRFGRFEFYAATRVGNNYSIASPIMASGVIGIEIIAKDRLAAKSPFYGGVNYIEMRVDSQLVFSQAIEKIDITETRAIYTLMDFKTFRNKGTRFYKLYIDDGNALKFYDKSPGSGKITVNKKKVSTVQITMKDSYGNSSMVTFQITPMEPVKEVKTLEPLTVPITYDITENVMTIAAKPCTAADTKAKIYVKGNVIEVLPDYGNFNRSVYLVDLRQTIPDSVVVCDNRIVPNINVSIPSGTAYKYYGDRMNIEFPAEALYDTLFLNTKYTMMKDSGEVYTIGDRTVPLKSSVQVSLLPARKINWTTSHAVYRQAGKGYTFVGGKLTNGRINFTTKEFGSFIVLVDRIAPSIKMVTVNSSAVRFKIRDELSGIDTFEASINGEWLLMHYDSKTATIWSELLNKNVPLKGNFELKVTDRAGNTSTFSKRIL